MIPALLDLLTAPLHALPHPAAAVVIMLAALVIVLYRSEITKARYH